MRRLGLLVVLLAVAVLAACDTDPPDGETDTGMTLHGTGNCSNGANLYWTFDLRKYDDTSVGAWFPAGPNQWVNCTSTTGDIALEHRVEGLERGTAYEVRLTVYVANNNTWHNYDADGTDYGTGYDQGQTMITMSSEGGEAVCDGLCASAIRSPKRQLSWAYNFKDGIGKNYPYAGNHLFKAVGSTARTQKRCKIDVRFKTSEFSDTGIATTDWVRPDSVDPCQAYLKSSGSFRYLGARYYIRAYLNDTDDRWSNVTKFGNLPSTCTTNRYTDGRDLLKCNATMGPNPPPVDDP